MASRTLGSELWQSYCDADRLLTKARVALLRDSEELDAIIDQGLADPSQRGYALRLLLTLPPEASKSHLVRLVGLATVGHADILPTRAVIARLNSLSPMPEVEQAAEPILANGGEGEFRRIAELYESLDRTLLAAHLRRCALHADGDIREIVDDFADRDDHGPDQ